MENKEQFGKLIICLRERDGLSQKELAEKLCVVPSTVCKWEKGGSAPDSEKCRQISELFQIPYEDLLHPEETLAKWKAAPVMSETESESEPRPESESKRKRHWGIGIAAAVAVVMICIIAAVLYFHNQADEWIILATYEQYIEDPAYGVVYEISYVVNEYPDTEAMREFEEDQVLPYVQQLGLETDIVKISYYDKEAKLEMWENPGRWSYYFLNNYEDV